MDIKKSSGLILHPSSLPGEYGIGDIGLNSFNFVDFLKSSETNIWQVLPLGIKVGNKNLYLTSNNDMLTVIELVSGNILKNQKISGSILSEPLIYNENLYLVKNSSVIQFD